MTPRLSPRTTCTGLPPDKESERVRRIIYRQRILPSQLDRARRRVLQLEAEAVNLGLHDLLELKASHHAGDKIASEWLKRLGVVV